jgi:hypothetical protein
VQVKQVLDITAEIECDCGTLLTFKKFIWDDTCFACGKKIMVNEMVEKFLAETELKRGPGRPVGSLDSYRRKTKSVGEASYWQNDFITPTAKENAKLVIEKFKLKYDLNKIAKVAKKYKRG